MRYGSLFSGAGGFDMGLDAAGLSCAWQVEIDKTARSVLGRHWPAVPKHEDVRVVGAAELCPVDVIVGGFPCQDVSVAGKGAGLAGARSGLWWEMLRVIRELQPGTVVFENVPGLRTNDGGRNYARVLCSLAEHGYFGCVRTLDARHFGVPQSRQRLFGVFARGDSGAGRACQILAVRESLPWHSQAGRQAGADVAGAITARFGRNGGAANGDVDGNRLVVGPLNERVRQPGGDEAGSGLLYVYGGNDTRGERRGDTALSAKGGTGRQDFETENFIVFESKKAGEGRDDGLTPALRAMGHADSHANAGGQLAVCVRTNQTGANGCNYREGLSQSLSSDEQPPAVVAGRIVRRFTPRECERLMGWPDDWTRWRADGSEIKDGPRYKMTGNGVVRQCAYWLGIRLMQATEEAR